MHLDKALFVALDNTLITTNSGNKYPIHSEDWKFMPNILDAIKSYSNHGYRIIIISNQKEITQGIINEKVFIKKIEKICSKLEKNLKLEKNSVIYTYCKDIDSFNTMPNPGMAYELAVEYEISLLNSVMIAEEIDDLLFRVSSGIGALHETSDIQYINWSE